jgi:hypothetical protein
MRTTIYGVIRCGIHWEILHEGTKYAGKCCMTGVTPSQLARHAHTQTQCSLAACAPRTDVCLYCGHA